MKKFLLCTIMYVAEEERAIVKVQNGISLSTALVMFEQD